MPVAIKKVAIKYKDSTSGQFRTVDAVSDETTADRIAAIEEAADEADAAITAKGTEVIESIPSDYTALADEVDDNSNNILDLQNNKQDKVTISGTCLIMPEGTGD